MEVRKIGGREEGFVCWGWMMIVMVGIEMEMEMGRL